jgi:hypothetical protein
MTLLQGVWTGMGRITMFKWLVGFSLLGSLVVLKFVFPGVIIDWGKLHDIFRPKVTKEWIGTCLVFTDRDTGRTVNRECTLTADDVNRRNATAQRRPWETTACTTGWKPFTPRAEGDLKPCPTKREWMRCDEEGRKPLFAWWCPISASTGGKFQ